MGFCHRPGPIPAQKLTLKNAEAMALRNHPQLQAATFEARAADQVTREEKSAYYPTATASLTVAGALSNSRIAAGFLNNPLILNRESNGVEVHQLITDFGRTSNLVGSARLGAKAASESAAQTQQDVLLAVNRAYYGVLRAEAVLKVAEETVKARQILTDQVTTLEKNKLKSMLDVSFAQVNLAQAQLLLVQAQNDRKAADAELATALGLANPQPFDLEEEPMPAAPPADPTDLLAQALQSRPDLASARFSHEAALRYARAERDLWMPTVSATGAAGLTPAIKRRSATAMPRRAST
jgi:outer membrane protein